MSIFQAQQMADSYGWLPPSDTECALLEAKMAGDWNAYSKVLANSHLFIHLPEKDLNDPLGALAPRYTDSNGEPFIEIYTRGLIPTREGFAIDATNFPPKAMRRSKYKGKVWYPGGTAVVVNPNTPVEAHFPWSRNLFKQWKSLGEQVSDWRTAVGENVYTKYTGSFNGPLAYGLASGLSLAIANQVFWNEIGNVNHGYMDDVDSLKQAWGIADHQSWRGQLNFLLLGENSHPYPEIALQARNAVMRHNQGRPVEPEIWYRAVEKNLLEWAAPRHKIEEVGSFVGKILRYEGRFRADGILPPNGVVTSILGYDYGRAVNLARWGVSARYASEAEAEKAVIRAGELVNKNYSSWNDLSAGYMLGRLLRFDEESFGLWYSTVLAAHRSATSDPQSPWLNIPFSPYPG